MSVTKSVTAPVSYLCSVFPSWPTAFPIRQLSRAVCEVWLVPLPPLIPVMHCSEVKLTPTGSLRSRRLCAAVV